MALALFDLDNTLLAGDSDHAWGNYLAQTGHVDGEEYARQSDNFYQDYKNGVLDITAFLDFTLQPLTRIPLPELLSLRDDFIASIIKPIIHQKGRERIQWHKDRGDTLIIITATNNFVTRPIATLLGIDNLLATDAEQLADGSYTGKVSGTPCFQAGKITKLNTWLTDNKNHTLEESWFYSDSQNDIPLLEKVTFPIVIDPDEALKAHANNLQWPIETFY